MIACNLCYDSTTNVCLRSLIIFNAQCTEFSYDMKAVAKNKTQQIRLKNPMTLVALTVQCCTIKPKILLSDAAVTDWIKTYKLHVCIR